MFGQRREEMSQSQSSAANMRGGGTDAEAGLVLFSNNEGDWVTQRGSQSPEDEKGQS